MLEPAKRPSWSEESQAAVRTPAPEPRSVRSVPRDAGLAAVQPRVIVALTLILGGVVWAATRGLAFYGLSPVKVVYDLDQPPLLLIAVAVWLLYRSRRR
jgi:hypothetical protein